MIVMTLQNTKVVDVDTCLEVPPALKPGVVDKTHEEKENAPTRRASHRLDSITV